MHPNILVVIVIHFVNHKIIQHMDILIVIQMMVQKFVSLVGKVPNVLIVCTHYFFYVNGALLNITKITIRLLSPLTDNILVKATHKFPFEVYGEREYRKPHPQNIQ